MLILESVESFFEFNASNCKQFSTQQRAENISIFMFSFECERVFVWRRRVNRIRRVLKAEKSSLAYIARIEQFYALQFFSSRASSMTHFFGMANCMQATKTLKMFTTHLCALPNGDSRAKRLSATGGTFIKFFVAPFNFPFSYCHS